MKSKTKELIKKVLIKLGCNERCRMIIKKLINPVSLIGTLAWIAKKVISKIIGILRRRIIYLLRFYYKAKLKSLVFRNLRLALIVSHSDYLNSMGGTEKYIFEQVNYLQMKGIKTLQIFPAKNYLFLNSDSAGYGVNFDGKFCGFYPSDEILQLTDQIRNKFTTFYIHHLLNWQFQDFIKIRDSLSDIKNIVFLHDFFACCPSIHMVFNDRTHSYSCISPLDTRSESLCTNCAHSNELEKWREVFTRIFLTAEKIVVPSDFVSSIFNKIYPRFAEKIDVWGHLKMTHQMPKIARENLNDKNCKIKLAYLGYRSANKGWEAWEKIFRDSKLNKIYDLYHIGSNECYSKNVKTYNYSFKDDGIMAAVSLLRKKQIDMVLLWSKVAETYSYTMYEAMAAGIPIITNVNSGNIAETVMRSGEMVGLVLDDDAELVSFLNDHRRVTNLLKRQRFQCELEFNPLPYI